MKDVASKGVHLGDWLTVKQAQTLLNTPDERSGLCMVHGINESSPSAVRLSAS
jgi:hypothetical protein